MAAATADALRSSSGGGRSADSYVGSLISLTSKSEIRYEGVLYNINTQESTIGLRNVRSFGTEGRKKDGPQVPPSDKIYEFILFRGSDIKNLHVKSSPSVQRTTPMYNDPAIIQSQYPQAASVSMSFPSTGTGSPTDASSHTSSLGLSRPTVQSTLPLYRPSGSLGSWGSSPAPPITNGSGLASPTYWQGYYGPSNGLQAQQQTSLRPLPGLSMPPYVQQSVQNSVTFPLNTSSSQLPENPPLLPPFSKGTPNLQSSLVPASSSAVISDSLHVITDKASAQTMPTVSLIGNMPLASPLTTALDKRSMSSSGSEKPKALPDPVLPFKSISEPLSSIIRTASSVLNGEVPPSLVTPGQFLHPGPSTAPTLRSSQSGQKDVEEVQVSSPELQPQPSTATVTEVQETKVPVASPPELKLHGAPMYAHHATRGGHERGRGHVISHSATRFREDFDFTAMNVKFNKDEVWGHLGKVNKAQEDGDYSKDEDDVGASKFEMKPVYVKDDFFDSLSCYALDGGSHNRRARFAEQLKRDIETFGDFSRHQGGWGPGRGGRPHGGYHGRGYGYSGQGRDYNISSHTI